MKYQDERVEAKVVKGSPQGNVLSPLLRRMVVDSLLLKLNITRYTVHAYTEVLVIIIRDKYFSTVANSIQGSLRVVDKWCKTKGQSINPEKTEVAFY